MAGKMGWTLHRRLAGCGLKPVIRCRMRQWLLARGLGLIMFPNPGAPCHGGFQLLSLWERPGEGSPLLSRRSQVRALLSLWERSGDGILLPVSTGRGIIIPSHA